MHGCGKTRWRRFRLARKLSQSTSDRLPVFGRFISRTLTGIHLKFCSSRKARAQRNGIKLPAGLKESSKLPEPIFTPATKAETGHDENISFEQAAGIVGADIAEHSNDLVHHQTRLIAADIADLARRLSRARYVLISPGIVAIPKAELGFHAGLLVRDPDGHPMELVEQ